MFGREGAGLLGGWVAWEGGGGVVREGGGWVVPEGGGRVVPEGLVGGREVNRSIIRKTAEYHAYFIRQLSNRVSNYHN